MRLPYSLGSLQLPSGLTLAAVAAALPLAPAHAQAQDNPASAADAATPAPAPPLDEIVVTARRRPELLQKVPVSVIALSAKDLESRSVTHLRSLQRFVPNLTFAPSGVGEMAGNAFIRGIGQEDFGVGAEPGVGFYLDGVYLGRTFGTLMNITDVDRVEVLRGPQGTLFGKNTIGGAISVSSLPPHSEPQHRASVILGNYDRMELRAVANQPLSGRLFARLSGARIRRDGHVRRLAPAASAALLEQLNWRPVDLHSEGDEDNLAGRVQLRWLATDALTVDLALEGSRKRGHQGANHIDRIAPNAGILPRLNNLIAQGLLPGPPITEDFAPDSLLESYATGRNWAKQDFWGGSAKLSRNLSNATLSLLLAYRGLRNHAGIDLDGLPFDITELDLHVKQRQLSAELQLTGSSGRLSYVGGLFLFHERSRIFPTNANLNNILFTCGCFYPPGGAPLFITDPRRLAGGSYAAYAQGNYALTDRLSVSLGLRTTHERKRISGEAYQLDSDLRPTEILLAVGSNRGSWNPVTYRAGIEYRFNPDVMAYASLARGYKSGGFNSRTNLALPNLGFREFKPETALTYEAGLRSQWSHRRLRFNATLFHTDYRDIQLRQVVPGGASVIDNAAKARIRGFEVEVAAAPTPGLTLTGAYGHLDPRYLDVGTVPGLTLGTTFQRTPRHSFTLGADFERPVGLGTLELQAQYSFRSKEQFQILAALNDQQAHGLVDARISLRSSDSRWAVALFGTNLTDERYRTGGRGTLLGQTGIAQSSVGLPRQIGVQLSTRF
jgi:iron complex outermembrane receptor protein